MIDKSSFFCFYSYMLAQKNVENILAVHCAPCLAGIKPSNLFALPAGNVFWCHFYNQKLNKEDLFFFPLCSCAKSVQIFVFRKKQLELYLSQNDVMTCLSKYGYKQDAALTEKLEQLKKKMEASKQQSICEFPHEIGLFLGYPVHDVLGFIKQNNKPCLFSGYWKVYEKPEFAKKKFLLYNKCKKQYAQYIQYGKNICQIVSTVKI